MGTDQKFSTLEGTEREQVVAYVEGRWAQYYKVARETRKDAAKLIAVINAGGAVAILAILAKENSPMAHSLALKVTLAFCVLGVGFSAIALAVEYAIVRGLFSKWRTDVGKLYDDTLDFDSLQQHDVKRSSENETSGFFVWGALVSFLIGGAAGICLLFLGG